MIIVIDGPAGAGKSTVAKKVAAELGFDFLDTGALYRGIAFEMDNRGIAPQDNQTLAKALDSLDIFISNGRLFVEQKDVSAEIRSPHVDSIVSYYSALPAVRNRLLALQRMQAERNSIVAEGRDLGSVVFPNATVKIYLTASVEERARRRHKERLARGEQSDYDEVVRLVRERDNIDSTRTFAPLLKPVDAIEIDSSNMTEEQVIAAIVAVSVQKIESEK